MTSTVNWFRKNNMTVEPKIKKGNKKGLKIAVACRYHGKKEKAMAKTDKAQEKESNPEVEKTEKTFVKEKSP